MKRKKRTKKTSLKLIMYDGKNCGKSMMKI